MVRFLNCRLNDIQLTRPLIGLVETVDRQSGYSAGAGGGFGGGRGRVGRVISIYPCLAILVSTKGREAVVGTDKQ